jgi:VIT1/CCC1 family predicted Fe2+/Mn2+ transporter
LLAFIVVGSFPLLPFVIDDVVSGGIENVFAWSAAMTAIAFFAVGSLKGRLVQQPWWRSGLETLAVGGAAAILAYTVGALLKGVT